MVVRLSPPEPPATEGDKGRSRLEDLDSAEGATSTDAPAPRGPELRLLGQEHLLPGEPPRNLGRRTAGDHTTGHEERT